MRIETLQLYKNRPDVTLTAYILDDAKEMLNGQKRPAVLVCPGGGYLFCSEREAEPIALRYAAMGYHAFVLRYSVFGDPDVFHKEGRISPSTHCQYPAPMRDIGAAFLAIHEKKEDWLVDVDRIAISGFSAGAHNCAMYATNWNQPVITEYFGQDAEMFKPAAAVLGYGVYDYRLMVGNPGDKFGEVMATANRIAYFGSDAISEEMLQIASPVFNVTKDTPPMFLWSTTEDMLVPVENTARMAGALAAHGVAFEVHIFENGPHGLSLANQASSSSLYEIDTDVEKWASLAECWLNKRLALKLKRKPDWLSEV